MRIAAICEPGPDVSLRYGNRADLGLSGAHFTASRRMFHRRFAAVNRNLREHLGGRFIRRDSAERRGLKI
jgi:hypothetical protein